MDSRGRASPPARPPVLASRRTRAGSPADGVLRRLPASSTFGCSRSQSSRVPSLRVHQLHEFAKVGDDVVLDSLSVVSAELLEELPGAVDLGLLCALELKAR